MKSSKKRSRAVVTDASDVIEVGFDDTDEFREATLFVDGDYIEHIEKSFTGLFKRDQPFHQDQVSRAADRQPFSNTFYNTVNNCFDHF